MSWTLAQCLRLILMSMCRRRAPYPGLGTAGSVSRSLRPPGLGRLRSAVAQTSNSRHKRWNGTVAQATGLRSEPLVLEIDYRPVSASESAVCGSDRGAADEPNEASSALRYRNVLFTALCVPASVRIERWGSASER